MNFEEMKILLKKFSCLDFQIEEIKAEIYDLRTEIQEMRNYSSSPISGMPKRKDQSDKIGEKICKIIDIYEKRINDKLFPEMEEKIKMKNYLLELILKLEPLEQKVIVSRYIQHIKWDKLFIKLHYSRSRCFVLHDTAIEKLVIIYNQKCLAKTQDIERQD